MTIDKKTPKESPFGLLDPDSVIQLAESSLTVPFTNIFRPLSSYINRVFELAREDGEGEIIKFYRPTRWSIRAIEEEHLFLLDLAEKELPVIAPRRLANGSTLGQFNEVPFAIFPKCGGRSIDEFTKLQWAELGRLLGRTHLVGKMRSAPARMQMAPQLSTRYHVNFILQSDLLPLELCETFTRVTDEFIDVITPLFADIQYSRIHGDCHYSNIIYRPGESFYLIDFDDMVMGTPVQDIWMLLPGYLEDSQEEIELFLEGYEMFVDFEKSSLRLIEPLRGMRYIHYMAWCGLQVKEDGSTALVEDFGSFQYWYTEINELKDQLERIKKFLRDPGDW